MAKKEKVTLTPEEIEAKKARKKEKRIIFGKTFERAIVWMLAVVLVYSVTYISLNNKGVSGFGSSHTERLAECRRQRVQIRLGYKRERQRFFAVRLSGQHLG